MTQVDVTRFDVTSLGEAMLRLSVPAGERLETMNRLEVHLGGAESNVCAALASLGRRCSWASRLPDSALGRYVLRTLRAANIDTSAVVLAPDTRLGTYYVEFGALPRATEVIYDRENAAITGLTADDLDWDVLLDTRVLHLTGITPALGGSCAELILEAVTRAKERGVTVSFDMNYRSKLWTPEEAYAGLKALLPYVDLLICGEGDAQTVFGLKGEAHNMLSALHELTPARHIILTQSQRGAAMLLDHELVQVAGREAVMLDRLGAGDALAAGVLDGYLTGDMALGLEQGVLLSAFVLAQHGDMLVTTRKELQQGLAGQGSSLKR